MRDSMTDHDEEGLLLHHLTLEALKDVVEGRTLSHMEVR